MKADESKYNKWQKILTESESSGESAACYCRARGIDYNQYQYWKKVVRSSEQKRIATKPSIFVPVTVERTVAIESVPELFLRVGGFEVLIRKS